MQSAFEAVDFADGYDLAVALATVGLVVGVLIGTALVNWAVWRYRSWWTKWVGGST